MREIVKEVSGYVVLTFPGKEMLANHDDWIVLHHMNVVLSNSSETARTSVPVSWPRSGYVTMHMDGTECS